MTVLLLALSALAADQAFKTHAARGGFSIDLPAMPRLSNDGFFETTRHEIRAVPGPSQAFVASHADFKEGAFKGREAYRVLTAIRDGWRKGKEIQCERRFTAGPRKVPCLEYQVELPGPVHVRERLYLDGDRVYVLYVAALKDKAVPASKDADRFFASFVPAKDVKKAVPGPGWPEFKGGRFAKKRPHEDD
ncbi:MAG: hypothetical protein K2W96_06930 [Gemmataceae bacterium]|nr:hypothetical protein [Gemmataceae bacterium]